MLDRKSDLLSVTSIPRFAPAPQACVRPRTVLVVEDTPMIRQILARLLVNAGFRVLQAGSATEALEQLWEHPAEVDLLVTDFQLPDMNGKLLLREVRRLQPEIRALFVTGDPSEVLTERFLAKPFMPGELLAAVNEALCARTLKLAEGEL